MNEWKGATECHSKGKADRSKATEVWNEKSETLELYSYDHALVYNPAGSEAKMNALLQRHILYRVWRLPHIQTPMNAMPIVVIVIVQK